MNRERNKALVIALVGIFFILVYESAFIYIWFKYLNILKENPFTNKGNWLIAGVYLVELVLLLRVYDGLKIGHLERWNIILSQCLALVICNAIMGVQVVLVVGEMQLISEIITATALLILIDVCFSILLAYAFDALLQTDYPAKNNLLI